MPGFPPPSNEWNQNKGADSVASTQRPETEREKNPVMVVGAANKMAGEILGQISNPQRLGIDPDLVTKFIQYLLDNKSIEGDRLSGIGADVAMELEKVGPKDLKIKSAQKAYTQITAALKELKAGVEKGRGFAV